ncbi:hypothetical protein QBC32DRAFT_44732 [Pseudoneurospora amorphoporcata]|uniref:2EXR domain-containing protein n=1 Tax=Pseudoneurospora amorphoporcata TaxID=241081 RepID=A0AAN6SCX4_9PEZI|nr:hypothetical protein QBC32DRAFT_44732 [Pseudoneurospora amorphoporcata]
MASSSSNNTFYLFPYLPWELRALIWEFAVSPRCIDMYFNHTNYTPIPTSLHACREARNHLTHPTTAYGGGGNRYYEKHHVVLHAPHAKPRPEDVPYIWINWTIDWVEVLLADYL